MHKKQDAELIIQRRPSWARRLLWSAAGLAGVIFFVWLAYQQGLEQAGFVRADAQRKQGALTNRVQKLTDENSELREMLARVERQLQIDSTAYAELDTALQESTDQIADLSEELNFYRNIISPAGNRRGLQIQDLKIEPSRVEGQYHYKLVLIQALNHKRLIKGKAVLEVSGIQNGGEKVIPLTAPGSKRLSISFKYFQNLEGVFTLPRDFRPLRIKISISTNDKRVPRLERWYDWPLA